MADMLSQAKEVLKIEAEGVLALIDRLDGDFTRAVELIYACPGRIIVSGIGKSGLIARKIVATFNSTGTPALFLHPVEGMHGDLGMVTGADVILAISNSGETEELCAILPAVRGLGGKLIGFTGNPDSTLGRMADLTINTGVAREACPLGLAPTASTTATLAMGDALAVCLLTKRGFNEADFKVRHPGGHLGERLSLKVMEVMVKGEELPLVGPDTPMPEVIRVMDQKKLGHALVVDEEGRLKGILADGDLRRALREGVEITTGTAREMMTAGPKTISPENLALEALELLEKFQITALPIVGREGRVAGLVHLHDLLGRGQFSFRRLTRDRED